jgi:dsRNA-specific ribonuclease
MSAFSIEEHLDTYFIPRNGIKFNPIRDLNYTIETLTYMTPASPADKITNLIINIQKTLKNIPFVLYECCAGIGGNTVSFLSRDEISYVHSFERVPQRQTILNTNVNAYALSHKWDLRGEFTGVNNDEKGYVVYFDPPWLPTGISGLKFDKSQYILKDAMVGQYTIEDWLTHLPNASLVVYRVPPGYNFREVQGWKILVNDELSNKKNARLVIAINNNYYSGDLRMSKNLFYPSSPMIKGKYESAYKYNAGFSNPQPSNFPKKYERKEQKVETLTIPNLPIREGGKIPALFGSAKKNITLPIVELEKVTNQTEEQIQYWSQKLFDFLDQRLANIIPRPEIRSQILTGENAEIWETAFTHKSYDPIKNYDVLEFLGDSAAELMFKQYISERFSAEISAGIIGEAGITNLKNTYMSKIYQSQIGYELGFSEHVRSRTAVNTHIAEDLVESFIGALMKAGNILKPGMGYILVYNFIYELFNQREIELTYMFGPAKTQIQQFFSNMSWGSSPILIRNNTNEGESIKLLLTEVAKRNLGELKIAVNEVIGVGVGNTNRSAEANAYDNALRYFISLGLNHDWLQGKKHVAEFNEIDHPEYIGLINKIHGKMMSMHIIRLEFITHVLSDKDQTFLLELHGHKAGSEKTTVLVSGITNEIKNKHEADPAKVRLLENFLKL